MTLLVAAGCRGGGGDTAGPGPAPGDGRPCPLDWDRATRIGTLPSGRKEVSGFVTSAAYPDTAWMVRDSGNPTELYSFRLDGDRVRSRTFKVPGVRNGDWEDLAYTTGPDGRGRLWILDNINRRTAPKTIYEVAEPDPDSDGPAEVLARYRWAYPDARDGNHDTEALFALDGDLWVISKEIPSRLYRFPRSLDPDRVNAPVPAGVVNAGERLVLASTTDDERLLLTSSTRTDRVYVHGIPRGADRPLAFLADPPRFERAMKPSQREAGDFYPHGGCDIVLVSEDRSVWLLANRR